VEVIPVLALSMSKRPRLENLRDLLEVGVSETALLKLLNKLNKAEPIKSSTFKRHVNAALAEEKQLFDVHHLKAVEGDPVQVLVANLPKLLTHFASKNERYSFFLKQAINDAGAELSIVLYIMMMCNLAISCRHLFPKKALWCIAISYLCLKGS